MWAFAPTPGGTVKTSVLPLTSGGNPDPYGVTRLRRTDRSQVLDRNGGHLDVEIDAVQQGAGDAGTIPGHGLRVARAPVSLRTVQPAWAWVHRGG